MAQHLQRVALEFLLKHYSEVQLATALHACNMHSSPHLSHHALNDASHAAMRNSSFRYTGKYARLHATKPMRTCRAGA